MIKSWDELPLILGRKEVHEILSGSGTISLDTVSNLMKSPEFPLLKGSKELKVYKGAFEKWLMNPNEKVIERGRRR